MDAGGVLGPRRRLAKLLHNSSLPLSPQLVRLTRDEWQSRLHAALGTRTSPLALGSVLYWAVRSSPLRLSMFHNTYHLKSMPYQSQDVRLRDLLPMPLSTLEAWYRWRDHFQHVQNTHIQYTRLRNSTKALEHEACIQTDQRRRLIECPVQKTKIPYLFEWRASGFAGGVPIPWRVRRCLVTPVRRCWPPRTRSPAARYGSSCPPRTPTTAAARPADRTRWS